ncbi:MAG: RNA 2',3'-cyclic phosphodiesterase [Desulfobacteraceae bacterium]|nr:MAG: RNA 2',3'-cyclic phosphodiesterase [Desulfobacteraceae bacterium]
MKETIRTFIAFELPAAIVQLAGALQTDLKAQGLNLRWVRPQNIHLTLKFLGEIAPARTADVAGAMRKALKAGAPFELRVQGMGVFPGLRKPRVLWIGLGGQTDALQKVYAGLEDELAALDFPKEDRPFKAHLTLARMDRRIDAQLLLQGIQAAGGFEPKTFQASELILFQSELKPQGAIYTPLARIALGQG